jgi:hypothetical protein
MIRDTNGFMPYLCAKFFLNLWCQVIGVVVATDAKTCLVANVVDIVLIDAKLELSKKAEVLKRDERLD